MNLKEKDLKEKYDLFKVKSKNFNIVPNISSFKKFKEFYRSNEKVSIAHRCCKESFLVSLQEWEIISDINIKENDTNNSFICIFCDSSNNLHFQNYKIKDKYSKFKEFQKHFELVPEIDSFESYKDFLRSNIKIKITHLTCKHTNYLSINDWQFLNNKYKHFKDEIYSHLCLTCSSNKSSVHVDWRWQRKYDKFQEISNNFAFSPSISNAKEFEELYDREVAITHLNCSRSFKMVLKKWMSLHTVNRCVISEDKIHLCTFCAQEARNNQYQKHLDSLYDGDFVLHSDFHGSRQKLELYHKKCQGVFEIVPEHYRKSTIICKHCGKKASNLEDDDTKKLNLKLEEYLKENNLLNFIPISDCVGLSKKMKFKSKVCGHTLKRSPRSLLYYADKDYCPECIDLRFKSENQEDRNSYFQDKLDEIHGPNTYTLICDYNGQGTDITVIHNSCKNKIEAYSETIRRDTYKCPYCESTDKLKLSNYISLNEKMNLYEQDANNEYKILTPFVHLQESISIKHLKCGTVFNVTGNTFKRAKDREICPTCKKEARLQNLIKKLKEIHGDNYVLVNPEDFTSTNKPLKFKHKCGAITEKTFSSLRYASTEYCPKCSSKIDTTAKLKSYTYNKYKGEYLVLEEYVKAELPILFRHKKCDRIFRMSSKDFQNRKVPCPHCSKKSLALTMKDAQERVCNKFGNLFKLCGDYKNAKTEMTIMCNNCSHVFSSTLSNLLTKPKCPSCKEKHL